MAVKNLVAVEAKLNGVNYHVYSDTLLDGEAHLELHNLEDNSLLWFVLEDGKCIELNTRAEWHELTNWYNAQ